MATGCLQKPEGLTVALCIGTKRMSDRNVILCKLTAVESLGNGNLQMG
jgi:magnesium-transporting ATPase (P-type)